MFYPLNRNLQLQNLRIDGDSSINSRMASSLLSSNPSVNSDRSSTRRKRRKKIENINNHDNDHNSRQNPTVVEWRSDAQQQIYSSKLLQALHQLRPSSSSSTGPKRVHETADRVLAATAKGRTRWSRAILTNRLKLKFMKKSNIVKRENKVMTVISSSSSGNSSRSRRRKRVNILRLKSKSMPAFQRKMRVLGRMVPGCRKEATPVVLEEAIDYIPALEMQVRAMSSLVELLSVSGPSSSSSSNTTSGAPSGGDFNQLNSRRALPR